MSEHRIAKGHIPNLGGEAEGPVSGWLRISPDISGRPHASDHHLPPKEFEGEYIAVPILVEFSEVDANPANFARLSYPLGEHPVTFRGRLVYKGIGLAATGIHYRSGFYSGSVHLVPTEHPPELEPSALGLPLTGYEA